MIKYHDHTKFKGITDKFENANKTKQNDDPHKLQ